MKIREELQQLDPKIVTPVTILTVDLLQLPVHEGRCNVPSLGLADPQVR
jgi:hypothetical protein